MKPTWLVITMLLFGSPWSKLATVPRGVAQSEGPGDADLSARATTRQGGRTETPGGLQNPFLGGVPSGQARPEVLVLTFEDAIDRALRQNLGLLLIEQDGRSARGARWRALSELLPRVTARASETREQLNLQAFGFGSLPGVPAIVGPFNVFDVRADLSQSVLDLKAMNNARARSADIKAAEYSYRDARDLVVLVAANLYLEALAASSRAAAAQAQLNSAQALYDRAVDLKKAGMVPGIDVLRSQVELQARQQRLIVLQNQLQKHKLELARAIGLPLAQEFKLADPIPYAPMPPMTVEEGLERAYQSRADYQRALELVRAAEFAKKAARGEGLPSLHMNADYGDIGSSPSHSHGTFSVAAALRVPIFQGGRVRGSVMEADAELRRRRAELEDLRGRIDHEVRTSLMDLKASADQVQVAQSALGLAREQLAQAQDRFAAGVVNSIEVVQAQEALATADENYISGLYGFNVAKATLARSLGIAEDAFRRYWGGRR